jgi:hypothetical protein
MADSMGSGDWEGIYEYLQPKKPLYCPHEPFIKQKVFLRYDGIEALYGGRAGGGKVMPS